jgi:hypothetical protein
MKTKKPVKKPAPKPAKVTKAFENRLHDSCKTHRLDDVKKRWPQLGVVVAFTPHDLVGRKDIKTPEEGAAWLKAHGLALYKFLDKAGEDWLNDVLGKPHA